MRKIIDGKAYDTDTATELANDGRGYRGDFDRWHEALYRTTSGAYFLAGSGGPRSHWGRPGPGQNEISGGEGLRVMTDQQAREWMEQHGTADEYEEAFGEAEPA